MQLIKCLLENQKSIFHREEDIQEKPFWTEVGKSLPSIYLQHRMCSVRRAVTNNTLKNMPQTSTVFYLAPKDYSSAQSICNWHQLNEKLQPSKDLFIINCKSMEFAVGFSDNRLCTINTAHTLGYNVFGSKQQFRVED